MSFTSLREINDFSCTYPIHIRFLHVAPQYFFYNLPASESKDILQNMLNEGASHPRLEQQQHLEDHSSERCVVQ